MALAFVFATVLLAIGMSARPNIYDEGIVLTGALRTMAGQIPHHDFYAIYGPLAYYTIGWVFQLFGVSILSERILFVIISGLIVAAVYGITAIYCSQRVVRWTVLSILLWLFGFNSFSGLAIYPVSLLNLLCVALVLAVYVRRLSRWVLLGTGILTGISELFRYDTGLALFGVVTCMLGFGIFLRVSSNKMRLREFAGSLSTYALGFAAIAVPALLYYLSRGRFEHFVHDIIVYPGKYYRRARTLPFPGVHLRSLENVAVYLTIVLAAIALYVGIHGCLRLRFRDGEPTGSEGMKWHAFLASFGLLGSHHVSERSGPCRPRTDVPFHSAESSADRGLI
jgi:hypothetical protein